MLDSKTINVGSDFKFPLVGTKFVAVDLIVDKIVDTDFDFSEQNQIMNAVLKKH